MTNTTYLFVLIFGGVAVLCYSLAIFIRIRFVSLKKRGMTAPGTVLEVLDDFESERIAVRFRDRAGKEYTIISSSASYGYKNQVGKEVKVLYDPADPGKARIVSDVSAQTAAFLVVGSVFGLIALLLALG